MLKATVPPAEQPTEATLSRSSHLKICSDMGQAEGDQARSIGSRIVRHLRLRVFGATFLRRVRDRWLATRTEAMLARGIEEANKAFGAAGPEGVRLWCARSIERKPNFAHVWLETAFTILRPAHPDAAVDFGERLVENGDRPEWAWAVAKLCEELGKLRRAHSLALKSFGESQQRVRRHTRLAGHVKLLDEGLAFGEGLPCPAYPPVANRVLYVLHRSLPYSSVGYSIRSQGLIRALRGTGYDVVGVTRLGFPWDEVAAARSIPEYETVQTVPYIRLPAGPTDPRDLSIQDFIAAYSDRIVELARLRRPSLLHAASNFVTGAATVRAARKLGVPCVYEVRGLWEYTMIAQRPGRESSELFQMHARSEAEVSQAADVVLAITQAVKEILVDRGVAESKILIAPNGVDPISFCPREPDQALLDELGMKNKVVLGFIGSITVYEGLDLLFHAIAMLDRERRDKIGCIVVGDGPHLDDLRGLAQSLGLVDHIHFAGRVPHDAVQQYYSVVDIAPFPRRGVPVCELVSPLKPFEAMSMRKLVICSDVAALAEIIQDGRTGLLHKKDDPRSLSQVIARVLDEPTLRQHLAEEGCRWVKQERDWNIVASRIADTYRSLAGTAPKVG